MRTLRLTLAVVLVVSGFVTTQPGVEAVDTTDTRLLTEPAISATHIAFIYAGDLYSADLNGIEVVMVELKKNPPASARRPAYPVKGQTLRGTVNR